MTFFIIVQDELSRTQPLLLRKRIYHFPVVAKSATIPVTGPDPHFPRELSGRDPGPPEDFLEDTLAIMISQDFNPLPVGEKEPPHRLAGFLTGTDNPEALAR